LAALQEQPLFTLATHFSRGGRRLNRTELSALHRAAHALARQGRCQLALVWTDDLNRRLVTMVARAGFTMKDGRPFSSLSVERVSHGTRSTFKGSLRDLAHKEGMSVATIRRDLRRADLRKRKGE
jgi:hypothetical protein